MSLFGKWFGFGRNQVYDEAMRAYDVGLYEDAIEAFQTCLHDGAEPAMARLANFYIGESYSQLGTAALVSGNARAAAANFARAVALFPQYPDLHLLLARAYRAQDRLEAQELCIDRALEINPNYIDAILLKGVALYESGRTEDGLAWIARAVEMEPDLATERYAVAMHFHERGDARRAGATFALLSSPTSSDANFHARVAASLVREGKYLDAIYEFEKALHSAPGYADVRCNYGRTLLELGQSAEAIAQLRAAIELNPDYAEAHAQLGVAYRITRRNAEARAEFRRAYELDPANPVARFELERPSV